MVKNGQVRSLSGKTLICYFPWPLRMFYVVTVQLSLKYLVVCKL